MSIMRNFLERVAAQRARCRAIVLKHFANDWAGNKVLEEIDAG